MLETIREYAGERLAASGEAEALHRRHAEFLLGLAVSANLSVERIEAGERHELVVPEADNLRAALDWALMTGDSVLAASIAVELEQYWVTNSPYEGIRRLEQVLVHEEELPADLHARALRVRGGSSFIVGEFDEGTRRHEAALEIFRELGDDQGVAHMLFRLAVDARRRGDYARTRALCDESLGLHRNASGEAQVLSLLGEIAFAEGRGEEALDLLRESARLAGEVGFRWWRISSLSAFAEYAIQLGKTQEAGVAARQALEESRSIGDRQSIIYALALIAWLAAVTGRAAEAGRVWGAIEAEVERAPVGQWEGERDHYAGHVLAAAGAEFERGRAAGRALILDGVVDRILDER
jgi:tetratricopeptide (TPR) repeat protein